MKFLIGLLIGFGLSIAIVRHPETRHLLPGLSESTEKSIALPASSAVELSTIESRATKQGVLETAQNESTLLKSTPPKPAPPIKVASAPDALPPAIANSNQNTTTDAMNSLTELARVSDNAKAGDIGADSFQTAWTPFRSKASAKGFASALQRQFDHAFIVKKLAPGKYAAGFYYEDEQQRKQQLAAVESFISARQLQTTPP